MCQTANLRTFLRTLFSYKIFQGRTLVFLLGKCVLNLLHVIVTFMKIFLVCVLKISYFEDYYRSPFEVSSWKGKCFFHQSHFVVHKVTHSLPCVVKPWGRTIFNSNKMLFLTSRNYFFYLLPYFLEFQFAPLRLQQLYRCRAKKLSYSN